MKPLTTTQCHAIAGGAAALRPLPIFTHTAQIGPNGTVVVVCGPTNPAPGSLPAPATAG